MDPTLEQSALNAIAKAARDNSLVALIGAGPSMDAPANLPSWGRLIEMMAEFADQSAQSSLANLIRQLAEQKNLLGAADMFAAYDILPKLLRKQFFMTTFDKRKDQMPGVYGSLAHLPVRHWITTNFDPFLRYAIHDFSSEIEVLHNEETDLRAALSMWSVKQLCIYLHGKCVNYESLVYTLKTYERIRKQHEYGTILKRMFLDCSVIAYGFSYSDPNFLEILNDIAENLGGATQRQHFLLTSEPAPPNLDLLKRVNFQIIQYSNENKHAEGKEFLRKIARAHIKPAAPQILTENRDKELRDLARILLSLKNPDRESTYGTACAALVVKASNSIARRPESEIISGIQRLALVNESSAKNILLAGVNYLGKSVHRQDNDIVFPKKLKILPLNDLTLIEAVEIRLTSYNSRYTSDEAVRDIIRRAITHVMLAQGMTVARAFLSEEDAGAYNLEQLVTEGLAHSSRVGQGIDKDLHRSICEILRDPDENCARALFDIAHASYALERLFLNPLETSSVGALLKWKVFFDSNIILRLLSPTHKHYAPFRSLIARCRQLGTPLAILAPFIEECIGHIQLLGTYLNRLKISSVAQMDMYINSIEPQERSPLLEWYYYEIKKGGWMSYKDFTQKKGISGAIGLSNILSNIGIKTEEPNINKKLDTSARETLWDDLRKWRRDGSSSGRKLRRNEASQVEWIVRLRQENTRAWFLSIDGQLRRALITINKGAYAGFVVTPSAWAHMLADLHWGEFDVSAFSAMMWSLPSKTPEERAQDMILREVIRRLPEGESFDAETIRDQVDNYIVKENPLVNMPRKSSDSAFDPEEEYDFLSEMRGILPDAVERILDNITKKKVIRRKHSKNK